MERQNLNIFNTTRMQNDVTKQKYAVGKLTRDNFDNPL